MYTPCLSQIRETSKRCPFPGCQQLGFKRGLKEERNKMYMIREGRKKKVVVMKLFCKYPWKDQTNPCWHWRPTQRPHQGAPVAALHRQHWFWVNTSTVEGFSLCALIDIYMIFFFLTFGDKCAYFLFWVQTATKWCNEKSLLLLLLCKTAVKKLFLKYIYIIWSNTNIKRSY